MKKKIENTAYHEAGHVFAFWKLDFLFEYVTINKEKNNLGLVVVYKQSSNPVKVTMLNDKMKIESITKEIKIKYAGIVSEEHHTKNPSELRDKDIKDIDKLISSLSQIVKTEERDKLLDQIKPETKEMITQNWKLVKLIAKKLLRKKTLTRKEIESLMKKHHLELIKACIKTK